MKETDAPQCPNCRIGYTEINQNTSEDSKVKFVFWECDKCGGVFIWIKGSLDTIE